METFLLILVLSVGFYMAWCIGANDVSNAMGTSVGSKALTLTQAVCVAAVMEFSGAYLFGSFVSDTVQRGIVNPDTFSKQPLHLVYGMIASLLASGVWLQIATYKGWPVSTTHSIIGALVGFGAVAGGLDAVYWENVGFIAVSWVISPVCGAILGFLIFSILRSQIFYNPNPVLAAKRLTPLFTFLVIVVLTFITCLKGLKNIHIELSFYQTGVLSCIVGGIASWISFLLVKNIHDSSEVQSHSVEKIFGYLQILTACLMAFAHGANDVANAIGPLSAAVAVLQTGIISVKSEVPEWILALGGIGIVIGLATWGWRVIETIGKKITELTPTRGFAAEFGAATTIVVATGLGLPISTTHTLVGAVLGVGLARGLGALNLTTIRDIFLSWMVTLPAGAALSIVFYYILITVLG